MIFNKALTEHFCNKYPPHAVTRVKSKTKKHKAMKTQITIIPFAILILFLMNAVSTEARELPKTKKSDHTDSELRDYNPCKINHSESLTPKNYIYESTETNTHKKVISFVFDDIAKATLYVGEDGNYHHNIHYLSKQISNKEVKKSNESTSLLDRFRSHIGSFLDSACNNTINKTDMGNTTPEPELNEAPVEKIYFKSDYDNKNRNELQ